MNESKPHSVLDIQTEREWIASRKASQPRMSGTAWTALSKYESLLEQLEAAERVLRLASSPIVHAETWATRIHSESRDYFRASNPAKNPLRKPGRSSECGHDDWQAGCPVCEREERDALRAMGEQSPASEP